MNDMNGSHLELEVLSALIDGALPTADIAAAEAHLASCAECQAERARLERTVHAIHMLPAVRPPRSFRLEPTAAPAAPARASREPTAPAYEPPAPGRVSWLTPGLLRSLAGIAAALMVVLFVADAFVPYRAVSPTAATTTAGGPADVPISSQQQPREAAPGAAQRGAPAPPAQFAAPASPAADSAGTSADSVAAAPAAQNARRAAESGSTPDQSEAVSGGAAAAPAPANAPRTFMNAPPSGGDAAASAAQNDAAKVRPPASPPAPTPSYPGGGLRPLHVGAGFGALAFLLVVASTIVARRRAAPGQ